MRSDIVDIEVLVLHRTEMAAHVKDGSGRKAWLPLSQIEIYPPEGSSTYSTVSLPEWLALEKELI